MSAIARRRFVKVLGKVAFGLVAFVPAARILIERRAKPASAQPGAGGFPGIAAPPSPPPPNPEEVAAEIRASYREGIVTAIGASSYTIRAPDGSQTDVRLTSTTIVWGGAFVKDMPVSIGDELVAWGNSTADGSLEAEKLWTNLANLRGNVSGVRAASDGVAFTLNDRRLGGTQVQLVAATNVAVRSDPTLRPLAGRAITVEEGQYAEVIGRRLGNGTVVAVTAYL